MSWWLTLLFLGKLQYSTHATLLGEKHRSVPLFRSLSKDWMRDRPSRPATTWALPKWKVKLLSPDRLFETPWTAAYQDPPSMGFSRQEYWSGHFLLRSSAYLRLLMFLLAILIPACCSSSAAFRMMYSAYKLNKQGDNIQPRCTPFPIWNQSVVPCLVWLLLLDLHTSFSGGR